MLFPDVVVVAVESDSRAEVSVDEVRGLGKDPKRVGGNWSEKRGAFPSANSDVIWIDRKRD